MNKKIIALFFAATIGLNSCTEVLEPNVDYGDKTYINDYSALVSAINDLSKSFGDRIEALNTLLKNGMAELKLSIDANTGAITVLSQTTQQGLGDINKTLFDGFSTISAQIDAQGQQIVYALNANGEIIRLQLETTGKLISAQILATGNELIKAINAQTNTLEERFNALTAAVTAGLKEVKVSIDANTGAITLMDKNTQASLDKIDGSLTNGFRLVSETIKDGNAKIVLAMNENGQLLRLQIDETGKLISAQIKASCSDIVKAINDQTKALNERLNALNTLIQTGVIKQLENVNGKLQANTDAINAINSTLAGDIKTALNNINSTLGDIKTNTATLTGVLDYLKGIDESLDNIDGSIDNIEGSTNELAEALKAILKDNGIYFNAEGKIVAISPTVYDLCQTDTELLDYIKSLAGQTFEAPESITISPNILDSGSEKYSTYRTGVGEIKLRMVLGSYESKPAYLTEKVREKAVYYIDYEGYTLIGGTGIKTMIINDAKGVKRRDFNAGIYPDGTFAVADNEVYFYDASTGTLDKNPSIELYNTFQ
ncbi:MAG: hypothetical protein ACI3YF_02500 [Prevotella sp.]